MNALQLIDIIQPTHGRTSCDDNDLNNGFYSNTKFTRCSRCVLLQILKEGNLPKSHSCSFDFDIDDKLAEKERSNSK